MRRRNAQQEEALASLQRTLKARDEFLSAASHELRTPITTLSLQTDGLLSLPGAGTNGDRRAHRRADAPASHRHPQAGHPPQSARRSAARRLAADRGPAGAAPEQVDLQALVIEAIDLMRESATQAGSPVLLRLRPEVVGHWDRVRIGQVITNLLSNAIKFGCGRPIEVELDADENSARVQVRDAGEGILPRSRNESSSASSGRPPFSAIPASGWACGSASRSSTPATERSPCRANRDRAPRSAWSSRGLLDRSARVSSSSTTTSSCARASRTP